MTGKQRPKAKKPKCNHCGKFGHVRRSCNERVRTKIITSQKETNNKLKANRDEVRRRDSSSSDSDCIELMVNHMMSVSSKSQVNFWIVDSGATGHMCNDVKLFVGRRSLNQQMERHLKMDAHWKRQEKELMCWSEHGQVVKRVEANYTKFCMCLYNLLSVSKTVESGKVVEFNKTSCQI